MTVDPIPLLMCKRSGCCRPEVESEVPITGRLYSPLAGSVPASEKCGIEYVYRAFLSCGWILPPSAETICSDAGSECADCTEPRSDSVIRELFLIAFDDMALVGFTCVGAQMVKCAPGVIADCIKPTQTVKRM